MAFINYENLPSENTPLTGGDGGNLNEMQKIVNVSNEVDEDYRVNLIKGKNLCSGYNQSLYINSGVNQATIVSGNTGLYIPVSGGDYTISTTDTQTIYRVGLTSNVPSTNSQTLYSGVNKDGTSDSITIDTTGYSYLCITCTDLSKIQIEKGATATTYEAFVPNQILVDNEKYTDTLNVGSVVDSRSRVNFLKSKNLYNNKTDLTNTIVASDGSLTTAEGYVCSQLISVKPSSTYAISYVNLSASEKIIRIGYYQQNGTPITRTTIGENGTITTQANCYYIRVSYLLSTNKNVQVEEGSTITSYQPYDYASIYVDNEEIYSKPVVLWENNSPTSAFAGQQITLSDSIENYSYYEVIFEYSTSYNYSLSTGKINTNLKGLLIAPSSILQRRFISAISGTSMSFLNGQKITTYGGSATDDNTLCVPLQVIGYK